MCLILKEGKWIRSSIPPALSAVSLIAFSPLTSLFYFQDASLAFLPVRGHHPLASTFAVPILCHITSRLLSIPTANHTWDLSQSQTLHIIPISKQTSGCNLTFKVSSTILFWKPWLQAIIDSVIILLAKSWLMMSPFWNHTQSGNHSKSRGSQIRWGLRKCFLLAFS